MKYLKKSMALLLSFMMVFTMIPATAGMAYAEDNTGEEVISLEETSGTEDAVQDPADSEELGEPVNDSKVADGTDEPITDQAQDSSSSETEEMQEDPADSAADEATEMQEDPADSATDGTEETQEDSADPADDEAEELPESSASYTLNGDAEALVVQGKAADSREAAIEALIAEGLSREEAERLVSKLFYAKEIGEQNLEGAMKGNNAADGSSIDGIWVQWYVNDQPYDDSLLTVTPPNDADQMVKARVWFELSGENNYAPGTIRITIPAYIFHDRNGNDYGTIVIPYAEDPSKKDEFNWIKTTNDDGEKVYVLTNTRTFQSASQAFFEVIFAKLTPHDLIDMEESDPFNALIEVTTQNTTISLESNDITARFDTFSRIKKVTKRVYGSPEVVSASAIPADLRVPGEDRYLMIVWYITVLNEANTYYYLDLNDWIPDEYRGFILSATADDPQAVIKDGVYHGYQTDKLLTFTVTTAYPYSEFEPDVDYTFHNDVKYTNREEDPTDDPNTTAQAHAETTWHYTDPEHLEPDGHYMVVKNGNDDTDEGNMTHKITDRERVTNDLHMWDRVLEGWFGSYPSALNEMQDIYAAQGDDGQIRLSYTMDSVGYTMPWMFDDESYEADGPQAPWNIANYSRPVTMYTQDYGLRINRKGAALTVHDDFEYLSVEFPDIPYVYRGKPNKINEDGSWYAQHYRDGTFLYTRDYDRANWPDIDLELLIGGEWVKYATASWKSGSFVATLADGTTQTDKVIDFSDQAGQVDSVRTVVTMQNESTEGTTTQAGISYDIRLVTALKTTDEIMAKIESAFETSNAPQFYIYNRCNLTATYGEGLREDDEEPIVSLGTEDYNYDDMIQNKDGYDVLSGYRTDLQVFPKKESSFDVTEIDYDTGYLIIHYNASVEERSFIHSKKTYEEAIADGRLIEETSGVWRDLLPAGMIPVLQDKNGNSAIKVREGDIVTNVNVVPNYNGSGRMLLEVYVDLQNKPTAVQLPGSSQPYYSDILTIEFDAMLSLEDADLLHYFDEDNAPHNVISFESSNDVIGTIDGYKGEPDEPVGNNVATEDAFKNDDEKEWMTDLDPDRDTDSFVYAGSETPLVKLAKGVAGLHKDVEVNWDGKWSQGTYYGDPSNARTVYIGGEYRYRLKYTPEDKTSAEDIILYDSIENFYAHEGNDEVDIDAPRWQGTFNGVNIQPLVDMGIVPIVYYSTKQLDLFIEDPDPTRPGTPIHRDFSELDDEGNPIWVEASAFEGDLSEVHMVAIDCTWTDENRTQKFHLNSGEYVTAYINMIAPDIDEAEAEGYLEQIGDWGNSAQAYNNASEMTTLIDEVSGTAQENFSVTSDYTKVGIEPYDINVRKIWDDDNNRDGYRPDSVTITLYANGEETGKTLVLPITDPETGDQVWEGSFEGLAYFDADGNRIEYSIRETPVPDEYFAGIAITDVSKVNYVVTNKHIPEVVNKEGMKLWSGDEEMYRPEYITIRLYRSLYPYETERVYRTITVRPNGQGYWSYSFTNLPKYEDGQEIHYRVEEVQGGQMDSYVVTFDGDDIINTYHPYGDLTVEKELYNATAAASEKTFTFNFYFTDPEDGLPVMAKYNYEVINLETGEVDEEGQVEYGSQVTINANQKIYVHDIDEYVDYEVTEENTPGFTMTKATGNAGVIKPNTTAEAVFGNSYYSSGSINLRARKRLENRELMKYQFQFEVYRIGEDGEETLIRSASSGEADQIVLNDDGTVSYSSASVTFGSIRFTGDDDGKEFTFIIRERIPDDAEDDKYKGYTYDPTEYVIRVRVVDNGDGTISFIYLDEEGNEIDPPETAEFNEDIRFNNIYEAEGKVQLRVWKELKGRKVKAGEFAFALLDSQGEPILDDNGDPIIAYNDENGVVTFPEISYDQSDVGKTYYYAFREIPGDDPTVVYDDSVYGYQVTISDNGDGTLSTDMDKATPAITRDEDGNIISIDWDNWTTEDAELPVFVNPLRPGSLSVTKLISDDSEDYDPSQEFHFFVKLIGEDIPEGELDYELSQVGQDTPDPVEPVTGDSGKDAEPEYDADEEATEEETSYSETPYDEPVSEENSESVIDKIASFFGMTAYGATGGSFDGVDWMITDDGTLVIGRADTTQGYTETTYSRERNWPWYEYRDEITSVDIAGTVVGSGSMSYMFRGLSNATDFNLEGLNMSRVVNMQGMFKDCSTVEILDLSMIETAVNNFFGEMFSGCTSLKTLDISKFNSRSAGNYGQDEMFKGVNNLSRINVSPSFSFNILYASPTPLSSDALQEIRENNGCILLGPAAADPYTGKWISENGNDGPYTSLESITVSGWWIWEVRQSDYTLNFEAEDGAVGSMPQDRARADEDHTIPANKFYKFGYEFDHWTDENTGATYADQGTIPAGTYEGGDEVTLTAHFKPVDTTVNVVDGQFDFWLHGGEMATFSDLPAGTAYEVWEETPDGWVLIKVVDASGTIQPLETANAIFTNKYQPDVTTAQFFGTKLLDNTAAEKDAFEFVMREEGNPNGTITIINEDGEEEEVTLPITVSTLDGGFISFPVIVYTKEDVGTHTYTIAEVDPEDDTIDWDTHTETVTVVVTENEDGTLSAEKTQDDDGIRFVNKTRPGTLKITKEGGILTEQNKDDEFYVRITFHNENGQPLGDDNGIYWYKTDEDGNIIDDGSSTGGSGGKASSAWNSFRSWASDTWEDFKSIFTEPLVDTAYGAEDDVASGTYDGVDWRITADYELIIGNGGTQTYNTNTSRYYSTSPGPRWTDNWPWAGYRDQIKSVSFDGNVIGQGSFAGMFYNLKNATSIDLSNLDTTAVTNMAFMFQYCSGITSLDLSGMDTQNVTTMQNMFHGCEKVKSFDLSSFKTSKVTLMQAMFANCRAATEFVFSENFDVSKVTDMGGWTAPTGGQPTRYDGGMFQNCSSVETLDLSMFNTPSLRQMVSFLQGATSLRDLDISSFDTSIVNLMMGGSYNSGMTNAFGTGGSRIRRINLGPNFVFRTASRGSGCGLFVNTNFPYTGCWIREDGTHGPYAFRWEPSPYGGTQTNYEFERMFNSEPELMAGVWVWEIQDTGAVVRFNPNGGYIESDYAEVGVNLLITDEVTMPTEEVAYMPHYELAGWDPKPVLEDGEEPAYQPGETYTGLVTGGQTLTLYAHWRESNKREYTVKHYQQNTDLSTYTLAETEKRKADYTQEVNVEPLDYEGFIIPPAQTVTIAEDDSTVVKFYYDRKTFEIYFDGNGATSGIMEPLTMVWGISKNLPKNTYTKAGSLFTGWNTEADGSGTDYADMQSVTFITRGEGDATLYAQWMDNPNEPATPTDGSIILSFHVGETIVIPDLPAGTTYTIEEITTGTYVDENGVVHNYMPTGWSLEGIIGEDGVIEANITSEATITNRYSAEGQAILEATKMFEGGELEEGQFEFLLYDRYPYGSIPSPTPIGTASNAEPGEDGSAQVVFDPIYYTEADIGKTYTYYIVESIPDTEDYSIWYDGHVETVTVTVSDAGGGMLDVQVEYDKDGAEFINETAYGWLKITKNIAEGSPEDAEFELEIRVFDKDGNEYGDDFEFYWGTYVTDDPDFDWDYYREGYFFSGETVPIRAGETLYVGDFPAGSTYEITELDKDGWTLVDSENATGTIVAGDEVEVTFLNEFMSEIAIELEADKTIIGRDLTEGEFEFGVYDEDEVMVAYGKNDGEGHIVFTPIYYTSYDAGETFYYTVAEVDGLERGIAYDETIYNITVTVTADKDGVLTATISDSAKEMTFVNTYMATGKITFKGTKTLEGREMTDNDVFTFEIRDNETGDVWEATSNANGVINYPVIGYTYDPSNEIDDTGTHTYTITETTEDGNGITVDTNSYTVTVTVTDNKDGTLKVESEDDYEALDFINTYNATGFVQFEATKQLLGRVLKDGEFEFEVLKDGEVISTATNDGDGNITFDRIEYDLSDVGNTYEYIVREVKGDLGGVTYDETEFVIRVTVTDNGDGTLNTEIQCDKEVVFVNPYNAEGEVQFSGTKTITGREMTKDDIFEFTLSENGEIIQTVNNDADGQIEFETITYTIDDVGTHTYIVKETPADIANMKMDRTVYTVTVVVSDNGDGTLKVEASKNCRSLIFRNVYEPPEEPKTGDTMNMTAYILALGASVIALAFILLFRRKKGSN